MSETRTDNDGVITPNTRTDNDGIIITNGPTGNDGGTAPNACPEAPKCGEDPMATNHRTEHGTIVVDYADIGMTYRRLGLEQEVLERTGSSRITRADATERLKIGMSAELAVVLAIPSMNQVTRPDGAPFDLVRDKDDEELESVEVKAFSYAYPDLWVPTSQDLNAEIYICARYDDEAEIVELVGWASRSTVADAPVRNEEFMDGPNRVVESSDLQKITDLIY